MLLGILIALIALAVAGIIYSPQPRVPLRVWLAGQEWEYLDGQAQAAALAELSRPESVMLAPQVTLVKEVAA